MKSTFTKSDQWPSVAVKDVQILNSARPEGALHIQFGTCQCLWQACLRQWFLTALDWLSMYSALDIDLKPGQGFGIFEIGESSSFHSKGLKPI